MRTLKVMGAMKTARGFTLLEVLVVVGIIALLATLSIVAFAYVGDRTKTTAGRVTMENLRTMLADAEASGLLKRQPVGVWVGAGSVPGTGPEWELTATTGTSGRTPDFWKAPDADTGPKSLSSPGLVIAENEETWRNSAAVLNTGLALALMRGSPVVSKSLDGLPASQNRVASFFDDSVAYSAGARVVYDVPGSGADQGIFTFEAIRAVTPMPGANPSSDATTWKRSFGSVLDPFGNPVIFVPSSGLNVGKFLDTGDSARSFEVGDRVYSATPNLPTSPNRIYYECVKAGKGQAPTNATYWKVAAPVRSPDGKPFWASAGGDGNFDTAVDNFYSFEN